VHGFVRIILGAAYISVKGRSAPNPIAVRLAASHQYSLIHFSDSTWGYKMAFRRVLVSAVFLLAAVVSTQATASIITYGAFLSGSAESPPNASPGTGFAIVVIDDVLNTMHVHVEFTGLVANTTASHIHAATAVAGTGTAGVATTTPTFAGFPLGVTSGVYDNTLDLTLASSYNPAYVTANGGTTASAETALLAAIAGGKAYLNIHTAAPSGFPGGEIRGFLTPTPEPASISVWGLGAIGCALAGYRRRKSA